MLKKENIEKMYDALDQSALILYEKLKFSYLDGLLETASNILSNEIDYFSLEDLEQEKLENLLKSVSDIEFDKEEIRKAFQLALLKAFKHQRITSSEMTPDTIGILVAYLAEKLFEDKRKITIFDPLVGTGNLLLTVANNIKAEASIYGVDSNEVLIRVASQMSLLMDYGNEMLCQDTLSVRIDPVDLIVSDLPFTGDIKYNMVSHHLDSLKDLGYMVLVVPNDYFATKEAEKMRQEIFDKITVVGLIKLPDTIFNKLGKSILVLKKNLKQIKFIESAFICDLPSFTDKAEMNKVINKIDYWFLENQKLGEKVK